MSEKAASPESNHQSSQDFDRELFSQRNMAGTTGDLHNKLSELASKCPEGVQSLITEIRTELTILRSDLELANDEVIALETLKEEAEQTSLEATRK